jgi:hypothetical protein
VRSRLRTPSHFDISDFIDLGLCRCVYMESQRDPRGYAFNDGSSATGPYSHSPASYNNLAY